MKEYKAKVEVYFDSAEEAQAIFEFLKGQKTRNGKRAISHGQMIDIAGRKLLDFWGNPSNKNKKETS